MLFRSAGCRIGDHEEKVSNTLMKATNSKMLFFYYGIFCKKCWAFLPLWEAPDKDMQIRVGIDPSWKATIFCDGCQGSTEFSLDTRLFMVESSRRSVRFRAPKSSDKGTASSS